VRPFAPLLLLTAAAVGACVTFIAACDRSENHEPTSEFPTEDTNARALHGLILQGTEPVGGALVTIDPDLSLYNDTILPDAESPIDGGFMATPFFRAEATDPAGQYFFQLAPFRYDLTVLAGRDVVVFRELSTRSIAAPLGEDASVHGYTAGVAPMTVPPPLAGHALAYFVSGADARAIDVTASGPLVATFRQFDTTITLHAVEYVAAKGIASATAEGTLDIHVINGRAISPIVAMTPITNQQTLKMSATPPAGYAIDAFEIDVDLGVRTSLHAIATVGGSLVDTSAGGTTGDGVPLAPVYRAVLPVSVIATARYAITARATKSGATTTSGRHFVGFGEENLLLPPPVSLASPIDDTVVASGTTGSLSAVSVSANALFSARITGGVIEHLLTPANGVTADNGLIRIITDARDTTLPDVTRFGLASLTGRYVWTVEHFPDYARIDQFSGEDARVFAHSWKSAPRLLDLH
jgi:hypothetical protein